MQQRDLEMEMIGKSEFAKIVLVLTVLSGLFFEPTVSAYMKSSLILFLLLNLLILTLAMESGILPCFRYKSPEHNLPRVAILTSCPEEEHETDEGHVSTKMVEKSQPVEKIGCVKKLLKKCPSMPSIKYFPTVSNIKPRSIPSLFFVGDHGDCKEAAKDDEDHLEEEFEEGDMSPQELHAKVESFIGNFYKQLRNQRQDSWKSLHDYYQKAL